MARNTIGMEISVSSKRMAENGGLYSHECLIVSICFTNKDKDVVKIEHM